MRLYLTEYSEPSWICFSNLHIFWHANKYANEPGTILKHFNIVSVVVFPSHFTSVGVLNKYEIKLFCSSCANGISYIIKINRQTKDASTRIHRNDFTITKIVCHSQRAHTYTTLHVASDKIRMRLVRWYATLFVLWRLLTVKLLLTLVDGRVDTVTEWWLTVSLCGMLSSRSTAFSCRNSWQHAQFQCIIILVGILFWSVF